MYWILELIADWKLIEKPRRTIPVCKIYVENFFAINSLSVLNNKLKIIPPNIAKIGIFKKILENKKIIK